MTRKEKRLLSRANWQTTQKERLRYFCSELGRYTEGQIVTAFMTMFLIFQAIPLTLVAGIMLAVKIIDAVDDVVMGFIVDHFKLKESKLFKKIVGEGRYLPWYRLTFFLFPLMTLGFFLMPTALPIYGKLIWFTVFYILYDFTYTLVEVPMNAMTVTLTNNIDERNHIITVKTLISSMVTIIIQMVWMILVSEYVGLPLVSVAIVSAVLFFITMLPMLRGVKEHNADLKSIDEVANQHYSFKDMWNCIKTNKYLLVLLLSIIVTQSLSTGSAVGMFASYYHFHSSIVLSIPILISLIPVMIAQIKTKEVTKKMGKVKTLIVFGLIGAVIYTMIYFTAGNIIPAAILLVLQAVPGNMSMMAKSFLLPDTMEYARYKTGKDCSGICASLNSFVTKLTTSLSASLGLFILGLSDWVPIEATDFADLAAQNIPQTQSALNVLWIIYTLIPGIGTILGIVIMFFYRLKDQDVELMTQCNAGKITREECEARLSRKY